MAWGWIDGLSNHLHLGREKRCATPAATSTPPYLPGATTHTAPQYVRVPFKFATDNSPFLIIARSQVVDFPYHPRMGGGTHTTTCCQSADGCFPPPPDVLPRTALLVWLEKYSVLGTFFVFVTQIKEVSSRSVRVWCPNINFMTTPRERTLMAPAMDSSFHEKHAKPIDQTQCQSPSSALRLPPPPKPSRADHQFQVGT